MGQATGGMRAAPPGQFQRRVGWVIPPRRNAGFGLAGDWQFTTDDARVKLGRPTCEV